MERDASSSRARLRRKGDGHGGRREGDGRDAGQHHRLLHGGARAPPPPPDPRRRPAQVPGFTLFRRTGSRGRTPPPQGVTLRGVGGSGASRAARARRRRAPQRPVRRLGVLGPRAPRGRWTGWRCCAAAASHLLRQRRAGRRRAARAADRRGPAAGRSSCARDAADVRRGLRSRPAGAGAGPCRVAADGLHHGGLRPRGPTTSAGPIDTPVERAHPHRGGDPGARLGGRHAPVRAAGTSPRGPRQRHAPPGQRHRDRGRASWASTVPASRAAVSVRAYVSDQDYEQTFSAVAADRGARSSPARSACPSERGRLPATGRRRSAAGRCRRAWTAGRVRGLTRRRSPPRAAVRDHRRGHAAHPASSGSTPGRLGSRGALTGGVRLDRWSNVDARRSVGRRHAQLPDRRARAVSPRVGALVRLGARLAP